MIHGDTRTLVVERLGDESLADAAARIERRLPAPRWYRLDGVRGERVLFSFQGRSALGELAERYRFLRPVFPRRSKSLLLRAVPGGVEAALSSRAADLPGPPPAQRERMRVRRPLERGSPGPPETS